MISPQQQPIFLAGPTASGKSDVALALARELSGEIIAVDSMQVYTGLDIGTAKPSRTDREQVPHHLVDIVALDQTFNAAQFVERARQAAAEIRARDRVPIFCGGTGLYFKAYLAGLDETPAPDARLRAELEATPLPELAARLRRIDPEAGARVDSANRRRVARAVELVESTGRSVASMRSAWSGAGGFEAAPGRIHLFGLIREREDLRERIERRVDALFDAGLVAETRALLARGLRQNRTAMQAIGYRQVVEHLDGLRSLEETIEFVKRKTWQFARRQLTWLRHQLPVEWVEVGRNATARSVAHDLIERRAGPVPTPGAADAASTGGKRS